jgi:hypothetical protein
VSEALKNVTSYVLNCPSKKFRCTNDDEYTDATTTRVPISSNVPPINLSGASNITINFNMK